jgi:hypothetical protein
LLAIAGYTDTAEINIDSIIPLNTFWLWNFTYSSLLKLRNPRQT